MKSVYAFYTHSPEGHFQVVDYKMGFVYVFKPRFFGFGVKVVKKKI